MGALSAVSAASGGARTASGNGSAIRVPGSTAKLAILVDVTAVSGTTPSCTFAIEWSHDGTTFAAGDPADTFTAITAASKKVKSVDVKGEWFRLVWTISGTTPSFTFSSSAFGV
jgi:hypothetical protein